MKLTYIVNARLPTEKAHGIQIMKMCESFSRAGAKLTLIVPKRRQPKEFKGKDPFKYYNVDKKFILKKIPCIDLMGIIPNPFAFWLHINQRHF